MESVELFLSDHILFVVIGLLIPILTIAQGKPDLGKIDWSGASKKKLYYSNSAVMWIGTIIVLIAWFWHQRSFTDFGFQWPLPHTIATATTILLVALYFIDLIRELRIKKKLGLGEEENLAFLPENNREYLHFSVAAFTAAVCEELVFRGFFMNYMYSFSGFSTFGKMSTILLPAVIFGTLHIYQGHQSVLKIILGGILFGLIYYYSRSLVIVMIVHFLIDLISGYVAMVTYQKIDPKTG